MQDYLDDAAGFGRLPSPRDKGKSSTFHTLPTSFVARVRHRTHPRRVAAQNACIRCRVDQRLNPPCCAAAFRQRNRHGFAAVRSSNASDPLQIRKAIRGEAATRL